VGLALLLSYGVDSKVESYYEDYSLRVMGLLITNPGFATRREWQKIE
jgi:hypothetical protein